MSFLSLSKIWNGGTTTTTGRPQLFIFLGRPLGQISRHWAWPLIHLVSPLVHASLEKIELKILLYLCASDVATGCYHSVCEIKEKCAIPNFILKAKAFFREMNFTSIWFHGKNIANFTIFTFCKALCVTGKNIKAKEGELS